MFDVIVVGAGPAGCTAARTLAEKGRRVLLVERCKLPRYKSCSGQLIQKTLDLVEAYFDEPVPEATMFTPTENRGVILSNDRGNTFRFEQRGRNVWRSAFDQWLAEKTAAAGAEIRDETAGIACEAEEDLVTVTLKSGGRTYMEQARYVVDGEGVTGTLKRKLTGKEPEFITTYQTYHRGTIDHGAGRVFFAGETAGFLNPMGEGVSSALESGHQLGLAIADHFGNPRAVLSAYKNAIAPLQAYMQRQWHLVSALSDAFREMKL